MVNAQLGTVLRHIRKLATGPTTPERTDHQLLHDLLTDRDQTAFTAIVRRHGSLVWTVCRHVLGHLQDAEDAFQATFLVLARHAASIRKGEALASWLHGVSYRTAMKAKRGAARRRKHEGQVTTMPQANTAGDLAWREVQAVLDEEIQPLPAKYQAPFVLCVLEGQGRAEVARQLGLKEGTVWSRLAQARKQLQQRLSRRGVTLSAVLGASALSKGASTEAVPDRLAETTARAAVLSIAGQTTAGGLISAEVANLVKGVMQTMLVTKFKVATLLVLAGTLVAASAGLLVRQSVAVAAAAPAGKEAPQAAAAPAPTVAAPRTQLAASPDTADE